MTCLFNRSSFALVASLVLSVVVAQSLQATTLTVSPNRDNTLWRTTFSTGLGQQLNDINGGASPITQIGTAGGPGSAHEVKFIISFPTPVVPGGAEINSVTLRLFNTIGDPASLTGATPFTIEGRQIAAANSNWVEGVGLANGTLATDNSGSTWNRKSEPTLANWATGTGTTATGGLQVAGTDYEVTTLFSKTFNALPAEGAPVDFIFNGTSAQLTALVAGWNVNAPDFVLTHSNVASLAGNKRVFFSTREATNSALRPQLLIDYTVIPAPEPSTFVLLGLALLGLASRKRRNRQS